MTQVTETITRPDGTPAAGLKVRFTLAGATRAFASDDDETVLPVVEVVTDQDGEYLVDLPANSELNPAGTRWRRSFGGRDIGIASDEIIVPVSGGPYPVEDILAAPLDPVSPGPSNLLGVIAHDWDRDGWAPFQQVAITAHGSQQFGLEAGAARGVVTGPGPEGSHRVALLRQGTLWRDAEVRSVVWGPLGAWTGNNAQQGHLHRVRQIGPNLWEGIAVWTSVVFGGDMRHLHVASVRWDGTTLWQSSNDGGAGTLDNAWIDRRLPLVSASRIEAFGLVFTQLGILPPHGWGIRPGTVVSVDAADDSFDAVDVPIQGVDPAGFIQLQYGTEATPLTVARGLVTPSGPDSQRRWCPFGMATRVRGGTAGAVVVEIKRWRAGWDPEPGWDDPRVMRAEVTPDSGGNVPEMALGPGLHGLWAAHFYDGSSGAWGPVTFTRLDQ